MTKSTNVIFTFFRYDITCANDCNSHTHTYTPTHTHTHTQTRRYRNGQVFGYRRNLADLPKKQSSLFAAPNGGKWNLKKGIILQYSNIDQIRRLLTSDIKRDAGSHRRLLVDDVPCETLKCVTVVVSSRYKLQHAPGVVGGRVRHRLLDRLHVKSGSLPLQLRPRPSSAHATRQRHETSGGNRRVVAERRTDRWNFWRR